MVIEECGKQIGILFKGRGWKDDNKVIRLFEIYHTAVWTQIHSVLVQQGTAKSEKEIREILSKHVIGGTKGKVAYIGALQPIKAKIAQISTNNKVGYEYKEQYIELYNKFMALASFRSFKHYCFYMQSVFGFTLWEDTVNCFEGFFYYSTKQILEKDIKFIETQCPTGYGKTIKDAFKQSWELGVDIDNDIFKVCGNDKFTNDCFQNVLKLMLSQKYAEVFPYFSKFNCKKESMFVFCSSNELKFAIRGSHKSTSLRIVTKLSDVNGVRARHLYLDDITQRRDMANLTAHSNDIRSFVHEWFERNYNRDDFTIDASGTTYSQFDLLSFLKRTMGGMNAVKSPINKYTHCGISDYIVPNGKSVFVCVPLLDYDTDESTFPKKISTLSARKKREENPAEFWAMDMQKPLPPDNSPFYFTKLRQYSTLPKIGENNRMEYCVSALDTKRRGKDFLSMPIFFEANDPDRPNTTVFYLVDWLYDDRPMKDCIPLIVSKIIYHKITRLFVERNTEECIEKLIQDELSKNNYTSCVIEEIFSTEPKDRRIMMAEGDIKSKMIFPQYGMYSPSSDVGKALMNVYGYTYSGNVAHDDAPDSLALFAKKFIMNFSVQFARLSSFKR